MGRYLFYRQNNLRGRVELGGAGDEGLRGEGWGASATWDGREARAFAGRARVLAPLDVPEDLALEIFARAEAPTPVRVSVNGAPAGEFTAGPRWAAHALHAGRAAWRRDLNDVVLESAAPVAIDALQFTRAGAADGRERGFEER